MEEKLAKIKTELIDLYKIKGGEDKSFLQKAEEYCQTLISLIPYQVKEGYLKAKTDIEPEMSEVLNNSYLSFFGVVSYPVVFGALAKNFKDKFGIDFDKEQFLTIKLPAKESETVGGGCTVAIYKIIGKT